MNSRTAAATPVQQLKTLCGQLCSEERHPRDIATWMPKAFYKAKLYRVSIDCKYYRNA
jgi:hypothetical protein